MKALSIAAVLLVLLSACATGPDYHRPPIDVPSDPRADDRRAVQWADWWQQFDDPLLAQLAERALSDNLDVRLALARVSEARAALGLADAERQPILSGQASAMRERSHSPLLPGGGGAITYNHFSAAGLLGWEIDLWGRLARGREAALAQLAQSDHALDALRLALLSELASSYFALRSAEEQYRITERTITARHEAVELERLRFQVGEIDELVLRQAESQLAFVRAQLPALKRQVEATRSALAILTGHTPAELMQGPSFAGPPLADIRVPYVIPETLPLNLLERRPDLRAAEAALVAANARVGVAMAARLPSLNLSALLGQSSSRFWDLPDSTPVWGAGASLFAPLLDFGRSDARIGRAEALREQAELRWRQAVLAAFAEVRDATISFQTAGDRVAALEQQISSLERVNELAGLRYRQGMVSYIERLDADRDLLQARLQLSSARGELLVAAATLFKAIGGGWIETEIS